jgi:cytochrome o ubiquinol oxidase subunit 2
MKPSYKLALGLFIALGFTGILIALTHTSSFDVLLPSGSVGLAERDLMMHATLLMLIVIVPVFILAIFIGWHYRAGNLSATYKPNWEHSKMEELIWWSIPFEIILVLSALTWTSTHELDPVRQLQMSGAPLTIEVVALPWKWLFIYPDQSIASVNEVDFPTNRPVAFHITGDAPMNSFWIPALGGQIYAMTGMTTVLNLEANTVGNYAGASANYSGEGFAQMKFVANALSEKDFDAWVKKIQRMPRALDESTFGELSKPSDAGPVSYYGLVSKNLFESIVYSFMNGATSSTMPAMDMTQ